MFDHIQAFRQPRSVQEAVRLLHNRSAHARAVAGGTDLVVQGNRTIRTLVDLSRLGLDYLHRDRKEVVIGATTTMAALESAPLVQALGGGILARAAAGCGSMQNRNMATLGGNLASASPAADTAPALLVLEAAVVVQGLRGRRRLSLPEFFAGAHQTRLQRDLLVEVRIPASPLHAGWAFGKLARTQADIAIVNVAAGLQLDRSGRCRWVRIALGAVAPQPVRATTAEKLLTGQLLTRALIAQAAEMVVADMQPISDVRASADYRRAMSCVLVRRALLECAQQTGRRL